VPHGLRASQHVFQDFAGFALKRSAIIPLYRKPKSGQSGDEAKQESRAVALATLGISGIVAQKCVGDPAVCTENSIRIDWAGNHLTSAHNNRAVIFYPDRLGLAIQVEDPS
jgi:hypothetical protein